MMIYCRLRFITHTHTRAFSKMLETIFEYLNENGLTNSLLILFVCCSISGIFVLMAIYGNFLSAERGKKVKSFEGCALNTVVDSICADTFSSSSSSSASYCLDAITFLKRKCKLNPKIAADLVSLKAVDHFIQILKNCNDESDNMKYISLVELLNQIFCTRKARNILFSDSTAMNKTMDEMIELWKDHVEEPSVWHVVVVNNNKYNNNNSHLDEGDSDGSDGEQGRLGCGCKLCQKLTISIGLLCTDSIPAQTRAGDRSLVTQLLEFIKKRKSTCSATSTGIGRPETKSPASSSSSATSSNDSIKWALWTIFQMTMGHPPNKYDFYHGHGIAVVTDTLKIYRHDGDILLQGLGLLLNAVVDDPQTKVSISAARLAVLNSGVGELLQFTQENFRDKDHLISLSKSIATILGTVWP